MDPDGKYVVGFVGIGLDIDDGSLFIIINQCPKCFSKFWFHVGYDTALHIKDTCPNWPTT
ncbi:MAG: hypothetical protein A3G02_01795 [Candidatus Yanofskybacteria bacterium RIFCSPLOWO2_12_FULL_44_13b]|nr:MAG: hypothetical protein A3G02_01795 [Candidatus Yanofskybacteria bacterium RIFCSPLOWO2_12_FULL_44_13b]